MRNPVATRSQLRALREIADSDQETIYVQEIGFSAGAFLDELRSGFGPVGEL